MAVEARPVASKRPLTGRFIRVLSVGFGLAVTFGNTIDTGILNGPAIVARAVPTVVPFLGIWLAVGAAALIAAPSLAELAAMMPRAGGYYVYARRAFTGFTACVVGWTDWLVSCGAIAASAVAFSEQAVTLTHHEWSSFPIAFLLVVGLTVVQLRGIGAGSWLQEATSAITAALFAVLIVGCYLAPTHLVAATPAITPATPTGAIVVAITAVLFAYDGWDGALYFGEEIENPGHDIPYSMLIGIAVIIALYVGLNWGLVRVLTLPVLAASHQPVQLAARAVFGQSGAMVAELAMMIVFAGAVNACLLIGSRVIVALGAAGDLPARLAHVNTRGTPCAALLVTACCSIAFVLIGRTLETLMETAGLLIVVTAALTFVAVFVLRRREPNTERPYRAFGYPITTAIALGISLAVLIGSICSDSAHALYAASVVALAYPVYRLTQSRRLAT